VSVHLPPPPASAQEVLALLLAVCQPLSPERVALGDALGRVLREPVCAPEDQPPFDRSSMDGFAVRLDDASSSFLLVDGIRAGEWKPRSLALGECVRIATGGAVPGEGLQVVMQEDAQVDGLSVRVSRREASRNIRFRGEDARAGQVLVEPGSRLEAGTLALLASVGHAAPLLTRHPRILHVATGNEIVPPDQTPQRGQIRDSNSALVRAFLNQWGIEPTQLRVPEDEAQAKSAIRSPMSEVQPVDLLLISGGASVGEHDFTRRLLEDLGYAIRVSKTNTRPGKPLIVAQRDHALAFGLPGNPLAHFLCLNLYVRVALAAWSGLPHQPLFRRGVLAADLAADGSARETFWPAYAQPLEERILLRPLRWSSSGDLTSLATANALIRVDAGGQRLARGSGVEFISTAPRS
jgi:molybdopterin molybdotransferase